MNSLGLMQKDVEGQLNIVDMSLIRKKLSEIRSEGSILDLFKLYADNLNEQEGCDLLVVDSLTVLMIIAQIKDNRDQIFHLFEWLRSMNATVFLVSESPSEPNQVFDEEFLADGVIHLVKERVATVDTQLRIIIEKMRATEHHRGYFNLAFKDGHFKISQIISE
jgi:KaiC/GvpD/RAD55 family RecA-like ATPase